MKCITALILVVVVPMLSAAAPNAKAAPVEWQTKPGIAKADRPTLTLDIRVVGGPLGTFIDEPSEAKKLKTLSTGQRARIPYSGFGGLGHSFGLTTGLTYNGFIGFETGFISRTENAEATYSINGMPLDLEVSQSAVTVPLLLRLTLPTSSVQPSLLFGMALHYPSDTNVESVYLTNLGAEAQDYQTVNFGFELEFKLPVKDYDVRIPLSIRGYHNGSLGESAAERMTFRGCDPSGLTCQENVFITEWQWAAEIFLGLSVHTNLLEP